MKHILIYRALTGLGVALFFAGVIRIGVDYYAKGVELLPASVALLGIITSVACSILQAKAEDEYHLRRRYPLAFRDQ
tara:strand:- start:2556 stop:2786 length:231 start_codon:yes stop_codon:yes gene_type:complete